MSEPDGAGPGARGSGLAGDGPAPGAPTPASPSTARASLLVALAACGFGSITTLMTVALDAGATVTSAIVLRFLLAAPLLLAVAGWRAVRAVEGRHRARLILLGGGGQAAVNLVSLSALHYVGAATLVFLFYTYPAWIAVFAAARGTERVTALRAAALLLSLAGIGTIVGDPFSGALHPTGVLLALGAAVLYALYVPVIGRLQEGITPSNASLHVALGAVAFCAAWGVGTGALTADVAPRGWLAIVLMAVVSTVAAFLLFLRGLAVLGPVRTGIVSTVEPFWAALLAAIVLGQRLSPRTMLGGAMIAAAVLLLQLRRGER